LYCFDVMVLYLLQFELIYLKYILLKFDFARNIIVPIDIDEIVYLHPKRYKLMILRKVKVINHQVFMAN
jgi:hypothetical protein